MISESRVKSNTEYLATAETNDVHAEGEQSCEPDWMFSLSRHANTSVIPNKAVYKISARVRQRAFDLFLFFFLL